jgi:hypothetical protein
MLLPTSRRLETLVESQPEEEFGFGWRLSLPQFSGAQELSCPNEEGPIRRGDREVPITGPFLDEAIRSRWVKDNNS